MSLTVPSLLKLTLSSRIVLSYFSVFKAVPSAESHQLSRYAIPKEVAYDSGRK